MLIGSKAILVKTDFLWSTMGQDAGGFRNFLIAPPYSFLRLSTCILLLSSYRHYNTVYYQLQNYQPLGGMGSPGKPFSKPLNAAICLLSPRTLHTRLAEKLRDANAKCPNYYIDRGVCQLLILEKKKFCFGLELTFIYFIPRKKNETNVLSAHKG